MSGDDTYVRSVAFSGLPEFITKLGGNTAGLFLRAGLNLADIQNGENYISWAKACDFLELAAQDLNEPQLGLKWALELPDDFQNSGPIAFLTTLVPDVRSFLVLAIKYEKIHCNGIISGLTEMPERGLAAWTLFMHPNTPNCRQYSEHIMAVIAQMASRHFDGFTFESVSFQHNAPDNLDWHESIFKCPVHFNADRLEVRGDSRGLDFKLGGSLSLLRPVLDLYLDRRIKKLPTSQTPMSETVSAILPSILGAGQSSAERVASALSLSPKKMQRLLKEEGTNFSALKDAVRRDMTHRLLSESDISLGLLAGLLDYASTEAFRTACQRWYGQSPRAYRQSLRQRKS